MRKHYLLTALPVLLSACATNKAVPIGTSPQEYASNLSQQRLSFVMASVFNPSISGSEDPIWGMKGVGVALAPFEKHCAAQSGKLLVANEHGLTVQGRRLPGNLECDVDGTMVWAASINYRNVESEYVQMNQTTWVNLYIDAKVSTASEVSNAYRESALRAYRNQFANIKTSKLADLFIERFKTDDPEKLVPRALEMRQQLLVSEDQARRAAIEASEREQKEFDRYVKTRGVSVCAHFDGSVNQPAGYAFMGQPVFHKIRSAVDVKASVEDSQDNRIKVNIARIQATTQSVLLDKFDTGDAVYEVGKAFWTDKTAWKKC